MFDDLFLADYSGTEPIGLAVIVIALVVLGIGAWRQRRERIAVRKRKLIQGPSVFRETRKDRPR